MKKSNNTMVLVVLGAAVLGAGAYFYIRSRPREVNVVAGRPYRTTVRHPPNEAAEILVVSQIAAGASGGSVISHDENKTVFESLALTTGPQTLPAKIPGTNLEAEIVDIEELEGFSGGGALPKAA